MQTFKEFGMNADPDYVQVPGWGRLRREQALQLAQKYCLDLAAAIQRGDHVDVDKFDMAKAFYMAATDGDGAFKNPLKPM